MMRKKNHNIGCPHDLSLHIGYKGGLGKSAGHGQGPRYSSRDSSTQGSWARHALRSGIGSSKG